jgi:hypothetical protein
MKTMRTLLLFAALLCSSIAPAQDRGGALSRALTDRMTSQLKLDSSQKARVEAANDNYLAAVAAAFKGSGAAREKGAALKSARAAHDAALHDILTPAQRKEYGNMKEEQRRKFAEAAAQKLAEETTMTQQEKLGLNTEQSTRAYEINTRYLKAAFLELTDESRAGMRKLRALRDAGDSRNQEMKALLSKEQYGQYLKLVEEQRAAMQERFRNRKG